VVVLFLLCGLGVQACSFRVPQAEAVLSQFRSFAVSHEQTKSNRLWLASFNQHGAMLKPYIVDGYTVFANESGDAVAFDGWVIRSVLGFGRDDPIQVIDNNSKRSSIYQGDHFEAKCDAWDREEMSVGFRWRQICGFKGHQTIINVDEGGNITAIQQDFGTSLGVLQLSLAGKHSIGSLRVN
jgi:hypothetical protein